MGFILSDSLMCMNLLNVEKQINILDEYMDWHHADIMDGHYCPNITLSPDFVKAVSKVSKLPIEVHLMTTRPNDWIDIFIRSGASMITLHPETINTAAFRLMQTIRNAGCKVGIALNPATPLSYISNYIDEIDRLTLMTVDVGYAGQNLVHNVIKKIEEAAQLKQSNGYKYQIQIDGCCNKNTYKQYANAGAEMLVMGSGLFGLDSNLNKAVQQMLYEQSKALNEALGRTPH